MKDLPLIKSNWKVISSAAKFAIDLNYQLESYMAP